MKNKIIFSMIGLVIVFICVTIGVFLIRNSRTLLWANSPFFAAEETVAAKNPAVADGRININVASAEELSFLPGIGTTLAIRIVQYRIENGIYTSTKELLNVEGITKSIYDALVKYITIG